MLGLQAYATKSGFNVGFGGQTQVFVLDTKHFTGGVISLTPKVCVFLYMCGQKIDLGVCYFKGTVHYLNKVWNSSSMWGPVMNEP